jgi:hypothetical protein
MFRDADRADIIRGGTAEKGRHGNGDAWPVTELAMVTALTAHPIAMLVISWTKSRPYHRIQ